MLYICGRLSLIQCLVLAIAITVVVTNILYVHILMHTSIRNVLFACE